MSAEQNFYTFKIAEVGYVEQKKEAKRKSTHSFYTKYHGSYEYLSICRPVQCPITPVVC